MSARDTCKGSANGSYTPRGLQRVGSSLPPHLNGLVSACPWASQAGASRLPRAARRSAQRPPVKVSASLKTSGILIRVRAECEWTMKDWRATMDEIQKSSCWGLQFHMRKGSFTFGKPCSSRVHACSCPARLMLLKA
jgi:hypothetical protein